MITNEDLEKALFDLGFGGSWLLTRSTARAYAIIDLLQPSGEMHRYECPNITDFKVCYGKVYTVLPTLPVEDVKPTPPKKRRRTRTPLLTMQAMLRHIRKGGRPWTRTSDTKP